MHEVFGVKAMNQVGETPTNICFGNDDAPNQPSLFFLLPQSTISKQQ